jgi:hypothetical protein
MHVMKCAALAIRDVANRTSLRSRRDFVTTRQLIDAIDADDTSALAEKILSVLIA